jgi:hypothetical protein
MARSRLALTLGVLAVFGAGACANLIGLDKFVDCTESPGLCVEAGPGDVNVPDSVVPDVVQPDGGPDADADAEADTAQPPLPDGSVASDWAKYRVPNYDGGLVDAASVPNAADIFQGTIGGYFDGGVYPDGAAFASLSISPTNEAISTWLRTQNWKIVQTFEEARQYCLALGGRVPTRIELLMLLDSTERSVDGAKPFMLRREVWATAGLVDGHPTGFWTSTVVRTDASVDFWIVDFETGTVSRKQTALRGVLCAK